MPNPWDPFPIPNAGDEEDARTYEGIGRVVSAWESVEFQLSRIYSIFVGDPDGNAIYDYGKGRIFRDRLTALRQTAATRFQTKPDQTMEGEFDRVCAHAESFSFRRNEVAHGIVMRVDQITFFRNAFNAQGDKWLYACIPPIYAFRNQDTDGNPTWAYTFANMTTLEGRLIQLVIEAGEFRELLAKRLGG